MSEATHTTVQSFLAAHPAAHGILRSYGLEKFESPEVTASLGSVLTLQSALSLAGSDAARFLEDVRRNEGRPAGERFAETYANQRLLRMLGLLPCGMKMPFKRKFEEFVAKLPSSDIGLRCLVEGNVNHELSYYPYIDTLESADELPDVIVSADINSFFHWRFVDRFIASGVFEALPMDASNPDFAGTGYADPSHAYTMLSANLLVLVVNTRKAAGYRVPRRWSELLDAAYAKSITMRGADDFFCNGVLLPFYQAYGMDGVRRMAENVRAGRHPAEMVKEIEANAPEASPFYIMPLFFAQRLKDPRHFEIVVPEEGAIVSPVFLLVKKARRDEARVLADFIMGRELGQFCAETGFPSVRSDVSNRLPPGCRLFWMGWDFLRREDPLEMKRKISAVFAERFCGEGGATCG